MKIVEQSFNFENLNQDFGRLEKCGRVCYQSEVGSSENFISKIVKNKHHSVLEHISLTAHIITNRAILAELTRHRIASFSVESSRYCNYGKDKFGNEIKFVLPLGQEIVDEVKILDGYKAAEELYLRLIADGVKPEVARDVLPLGTAVEMYMTANIREWLHIIELRTSPAAHPQIRELLEVAKKQLAAVMPELFE